MIALRCFPLGNLVRLDFVDSSLNSAVFCTFLKPHRTVLFILSCVSRYSDLE